MVSGSFSLPFRGSFHLSLTVLFSIGHQVVFSLGRRSSLLHTGFLVSGATLVPSVLLNISLTGLLPSSVRISILILLYCSVTLDGPQPHALAWFGLFPFRSPLLRNSIFLSLPPAT